MKTDLFQSSGHCWVFQICWRIERSTFTESSFRIWNSSTGIPSPPLALFVVMLSKAHSTSHSRMSGSRWVITPSWLPRSWRSLVYGVTRNQTTEQLSLSFSEYIMWNARLDESEAGIKSPGETSTMSRSLESRLVSEISFVFILEKVKQLDWLKGNFNWKGNFTDVSSYSFSYYY